jgi:hypothetical protein
MNSIHDMRFEDCDGECLSEKNCQLVACGVSIVGGRHKVLLRTRTVSLHCIFDLEVAQDA